MLLLSATFDAARPAARPLPWRAIIEAAAVSSCLIAVAFAIGLGAGPSAVLGRAVTGGAAQAGLLAVGWAIIRDGGEGWRRPAFRTGIAVVLASLLSRLSAWGALAYLAVPAAFVAERQWERRLAAAGLGWPRARFIGLGAAAGVFLGAHLLIASSLTFGYAVRIASLDHYLSAVAYDAGANAVSAEWVFRGALFVRWWRRWPLVAAASLSTGCAVVRYVLDPNVPDALEARLGAVFYTGLLGFAACALRARSGSLVPGYVATVLFFVTYRTLSN